jgi:hypothetical protein
MIENRRLHFRTGLSSLYLPFYDKLCEALGPEWQPYSGLRTFDEQTALYNQGRITPGKIVTKAKAGQSAHNYGCATDWIIFDQSGQPIWIKSEDPRYQDYWSAVESVGLKPGKLFGDNDHNELNLSCDWPHIYLAFNQGGQKVAQQKIEESIIK